MTPHDTAVTAIFTKKASTVHNTAPDATVSEAVATMNQHHVGSILVLEAGQVVGIFTERDVLVRVVAEKCDPTTTLVRDVMTSDLQVITPQTTIGETMQLMTEKRTRHLPVLDGKTLVGLVSIGDITRYLLEMHESEIANIKEYAFGPMSPQ